MDLSHYPKVFFPKPQFHAPAHRDGLTLAARRALATFELAAGGVSSSGERAAIFSSGRPSAHLPVLADHALNAKEVELLLDRNLLPRFRDAGIPAAGERGLESIEIIAIAVIVGSVLVKLLV